MLAAGRSERLSRVTRGGSKALIRVAGTALVERSVRVLLASGWSGSSSWSAITPGPWRRS